MTDPSPATTASRRPPRRVFIRELEVMASVGVFEVEHRYEQRILVSIELEVIDQYDGKSERISDVLDYSQIVAAVEVLVQSGHFKLIETLAERIAEGCLEHAMALSASIRIEKPDIVPGCRSVGIEILRARHA